MQACTPGEIVEETESLLAGLRVKLNTRQRRVGELGDELDKEAEPEISVGMVCEALHSDEKRQNKVGRLRLSA